MCQLTPAASIASMIVGTCGTDVASNAPPCGNWVGSSAKSGMHVGWLEAVPPPAGFFQGAVAPESQPQPFVANLAWDGLTPWNPSRVEATRSRCEPQLADTLDSNVRSATTYCWAYIDRFGIWLGR